MFFFFFLNDFFLYEFIFFFLNDFIYDFFKYFFTTQKLGYLHVIAPQGLPTRLRLGFKFRGCWPGAVWGWWS